MSTRTRQEGASLFWRVVALILLPIIIVALIVIAFIFAIAIIVGGVIDALQFAFFGTTGTIRWIGARIEGVGRWIERTVS